MDKTFEEEQAHLSEVYATIERLRDDLIAQLEADQQLAAKDLADLSAELRPDVAGVEADETMETLAAIETLNAVIDAYNQRHDFARERLQRVRALLTQPYFAKVRLKMRPGRPARDIYIGAVGLTDDNRVPIVVDWRAPVAETYYKQENGQTSFTVDGRVRNVELLLRRQFDIERDILKMYFDTTVAIEDSLLLGALKRHHSEKLQAITATIQREQNEVIRHEDTDALLVTGVAGSGKTSVMLQRIAYLFYQQRGHLDPEQVVLFTPNSVFQSYIDSVLPSMGESNPQVFTWESFVERHGLAGRDAGADCSVDSLILLEKLVVEATCEEEDVRDIRVGDEVLLKASQVKSSLDKFSRFPLGPKRVALARDEMHSRLERRISTLAHRDVWQEEMLALDVDEQLEIFGDTVSPENEEETTQLTRIYLAHRFGAAQDAIDNLSWLRIDRIGSRLLGGRSLNATEWLWLRLLIAREGAPSVRYVMIDEVQDYATAQLMLISRFFSQAHFLMLGDPNQAIRANTASFAEIRDVFREPDTCALRTSYRSSPEITELFSSLLTDEERGTLSSVRRAGILPRIETFDDTAAYLDALREAASTSQHGLTAVIATDPKRVSWLAKQLAGVTQLIRRHDALPATGVVVLDLKLAKGLEFDHVILADASDEVYGTDELSRRRLYTALSRAMHEVTVFAQGRLTPLFDSYLATHAAGSTSSVKEGR